MLHVHVLFSSRCIVQKFSFDAEISNVDVKARGVVRRLDGERLAGVVARLFLSVSVPDQTPELVRAALQLT